MFSWSTSLFLKRTASCFARPMSRSAQVHGDLRNQENSADQELARVKGTKEAKEIEISSKNRPESLDFATKKDFFKKAVTPMNDLPAEWRPVDIGFWKTERGLELKDQILTFTGRVARLFFSKERYDNLCESALEAELMRLTRNNAGDDAFLKLHGPEWMMGQIVMNLGGAVKVQYDDRWVEDPRCMRTPKRKDFRMEGIDLRKSSINYLGLKYLYGTKHCRYLNIGDAKHFDDLAMACLHPIADSLEFLDVSGTSVTERGFGYLRMFPKLKFLNLSRLKKARNLEALMPYIIEILPEGCVVLTNDETPSEMYGHPIPFRSFKNPKKDLPALAGNKYIGNLMVYEKQMGALEFYRPEAVHELWMTPLMGRIRTLKLHWQKDLDNSWSHQLVKYIVKANRYKPLL